jgi:ribosomal protein S18 acetylase RimI-like enzyme
MVQTSQLTVPHYARVADVRRVIAVLRSVGGDMVIAEQFRSAAYIKRVRLDCSKRRYWIVELNGNVAGVMMLRAPEIFYIAVRRKYRRLGVARSLIVYTKKHRRTLSAMSRADNLAIHRLLGSEGFRHVRFLAANEQWIAYTWSRSLSPPRCDQPAGQG